MMHDMEVPENSLSVEFSSPIPQHDRNNDDGSSSSVGAPSDSPAAISSIEVVRTPSTLSSKMTSPEAGDAVGNETAQQTIDGPLIPDTTQDAPSTNEATDETDANLMVPLMMRAPRDVADSTFRSRNRTKSKDSLSVRRRTRRPGTTQSSKRRRNLLNYCCQDRVVRSTLSYMNMVARGLVWTSLLALAAAVVWYSHELINNGTDPHLIAWFSAGAFVLLGFPISMYGIVMHLMNYNQPHIQCYIVRILWMVPIYSIESWLCLRFHRYAIYIETLRDCYESYVLYCFLQFLIQVLGGEEELVLMLKDKSPTRGVHMWGLQWCVRPWLMGQPVSRTVVVVNNNNNNNPEGAAGGGGPEASAAQTHRPRPVTKRVHWTSPFFVKCKVGVLQYVLLKFVSSLFVMVLELQGIYKEGDFTPRGGYLYICILTNLSQCWALYCLIFFYYATKNELGPIRPVGKFLSVKALVFFTWWQSVGISMLYQMDMIPHYRASSEPSEWTSEDVAKGLQDYLICIEMFVGAIVHIFVFPHTDYLAEAVAARTQPKYKSMSGVLQKRLGRKHLNQSWYHTHRDDRSVSSKNSAYDYDLEMGSHGTAESSAMEAPGPAVPPSSSSSMLVGPAAGATLDDSSSLVHSTASGPNLSRKPSQIVEEDDDDDDDDSNADERQDDGESDEEYDMVEDSPVPLKPKTGFVKALLDSTIPRDVMDNTVGMVKGQFVVEKKTLLHHAATSDQYDLFSPNRTYAKKQRKEQS